MNNNRGQNNRRRSRNNNNRGQNNRGGVDSANRIDSRARGNAAQMLDKYKKMANDAAMNDDGVNSEYYLQFADHYFRVLADNKARQEEERAKREAERAPNGDDRNDNRGPRSDSKDDQNDRRPARRNTRRTAPQAENNEDATGDVKADAKPAEEKPKVRRTRKAPERKANGDDTASIDMAALPPAIGSDDTAEEKPKPRRGRPSKADSDKPPVAAE